MNDFIFQLGFSKHKRYAYYFFAAALNAVLLIPAVHYLHSGGGTPDYATVVCAILAFFLAFSPASLFDSSNKDPGYWITANAAALLVAALFVKGIFSFSLVLFFAALFALIASIIILLIPKRNVNGTTI